jgi:hypothetical protein
MVERLVWSSGRFVVSRGANDVYSVKPKSFSSSAPHGSLALQNHIQQSATYAMALRKGDLATLKFDCSSQQTNDVIIAKYTFISA